MTVRRSCWERQQSPPWRSLIPIHLQTRRGAHVSCPPQLDEDFWLLVPLTTIKVSTMGYSSTQLASHFLTHFYRSFFLSWSSLQGSQNRRLWALSRSSPLSLGNRVRAFGHQTILNSFSRLSFVFRGGWFIYLRLIDYDRYIATIKS